MYHAPVEIMGLEIDPVSLEEIVGCCLRGEGLGVVITPNANFFVKSSQDVEIRSLYNSADLKICDSRIVAGLARLSGVPISTVPGSDIVYRILNDPQAADLKIVMIGGRPGDSKKICTRFGLTSFQQVLFPFKAGFADHELNDFADEFDGEFDIAFVCLGTPLQERLALALQKISAARVPTLLCVGASIDFLVGYERRAPAFINRIGLEWFFRFTQNPRRLFRRYFVENLSIGPIYLRWRAKRLRDQNLLQ